MIRAFETEGDPVLTPTANLNNKHIPIFAVSASLLGKDAPNFIEAGFDGWIMKPIDFIRLGTMLKASWRGDLREGLAYQPGQWVKGGWFKGKA